VEGYDVVTGTGRLVGRAVGVSGQFLVVDLGRVFRSRRLVPLAFVHLSDADRTVAITVRRETLRSSPRDETAAAAHYGVAA
jgi:hypothetical protein